MPEQPNKEFSAQYMVVVTQDGDEYVATAPSWETYEGRGDTATEAISVLRDKIHEVAADAAAAGLPDYLPDSDLEFQTAPQMIGHFRSLLDAADRAGNRGDPQRFILAVELLAQHAEMYVAMMKQQVSALDGDIVRDALHGQYRRAFAEQAQDPSKFADLLGRFFKRYNP